MVSWPRFLFVLHVHDRLSYHASDIEHRGVQRSLAFRLGWKKARTGGRILAHELVELRRGVHFLEHVEVLRLSRRKAQLFEETLS